MRRVRIGITLGLAVLAALTLRSIGAPRSCPVEHGPSLAKPGVCRSCRGRTGSISHAVCGRCAGAKGCCAICAGPLQGGLETAGRRIFGDR